MLHCENCNYLKSLTLHRGITLKNAMVCKLTNSILDETTLSCGSAYPCSGAPAEEKQETDSNAYWKFAYSKKHAKFVNHE